MEPLYINFEIRFHLLAVDFDRLSFGFHLLVLAGGLFEFRCSGHEILPERVLKLGAGRLSFCDLGR